MYLLHKKNINQWSQFLNLLVKMKQKKLLLKNHMSNKKYKILKEDNAELSQILKI